MNTCNPRGHFLPGYKCPLAVLSWSSLSKSCFGRHLDPSQNYSASSQPFFSKPLHLFVPAFLVNLLLDDTPNILDRMKLRDSKRVHLYAGGAQNGLFCPCPFHNPSFASVPALAWAQDVWFSSMSYQPPPSQFWRQRAFRHSNPFFQFQWGDSLLVPDGLDELVPLLFWHLYCSSSTFCLSLCGFSCLYALAHSVNGDPGQPHLHKINHNRHLS